MTGSQEREKRSAIEASIEIGAPPEAVWKALTDGESLAHWFPLAARVVPGKDGEIWMSWGPPWEGKARIEVWEPNRRLRTRGFLEAAGVVIEYTLETHGGKTVVRLVHSGFEPRTDWDDEHYEGTRRGWRFELHSLRLYLERHRDQSRAVAWPRVPVALTAEDVWRRLFGREGLACEGSVDGLHAGDGYRLTARGGERFEGRVLVNDPPYEFAGTVTNLDEALFGVRTHEIGGPDPSAGHQASVWLSTWGRAPSEVEEFGRRWQSDLARLLAERASQRPLGGEATG